ncbi:unnamed protein product, partial [Mesorhabditis belari]|uniref:Sperm surface protein Sp17 n=1 Tax=Mesorhabditis belari TaxID=2138241 RepID=A0AAF3EVD0_9BILA
MSNDRFRVPDGLRPLLEALARESIRAQPKDLISFGQLFFDSLQQHKMSNPSTNIIGEPLAYEMFRTDLQRRNNEMASKDDERPGSPLDTAATKIQAVFKGHMVRKNPERFGIKPSMSRTHSSGKMSMVDNKKDQKRHSIGGYTIESDSPEDRAATKIQAEIRGFLARKKVEKMKKEDAEAATKIQAHIRGFLTRKHLEQQGKISPRGSSAHSSRSDLDK